MVFEGVAAGLATTVLARMGRQVETAARQHLDPIGAEELRASSLLAGIRFENSTLRAKVDLPAGVTDAQIGTLFRSPEAEAVSFELLTVLLTASTSTSRKRISDQWEDLVSRKLPAARDIAEQLFNVLTDHFEVAVDLVRSECPRAFERLREDSHHRRIACVLEAIDGRLDSTKRQPVSPSDMRDFVDLYRRQVRQAHKDITPPDFDRRRDVPVEDLYVSPTITYLPSAQAEPETIENLFDEVDRTVLLGDPGNGKSTASQVLLYQTAKNSNAPVPFLVILRDFARSKLDRSVVEYLRDRLKNVYQCQHSEEYIEHLLETGQALVIFDGLDELLDTSHRRQVTDAVSLFCERYPLTRTLVTSRRIGYRQAPMDGNQFRTLELSGFDRDQVHTYVRRWFSQEDLSEEQVQSWTSSFMQESESVSDLTTTPLLLALMCIIYRGERSLPRNRPAVYERCATMLFDKWDSSRGINSDLRVGQLVDPAMKHLAFWLYSNDTSDGVTESSLVRETTKYLHERSFEDERDAEAAAQEFVEFCRGRAWVFTDVGTTSDGESLYKFTHRTFLEYFAAYHLSRTTDTPEKVGRRIASKVANAEWDVVAQLAVQITDKHSDRGAIRIFDVLLNEKRKRATHKRGNLLSFLTRCLTFVQVSPGVLRQLTREVVSSTLDQRIDKFRGASGAEPLAILLANSHFVDNGVIEDELFSCLSESLESFDVDTSDSVLSLMTTPQLIFTLGPDTPVHGEPTKRWTQWFENWAERNRDKYLARFGESHELSIFAVQRGWIELTSLLRVFDQGLDPIFRPVPIRALNISFIDYSYALVRAAVTGYVPYYSSLDRRDRESYLKDLEYIADYVDERRRDGLPIYSERSMLFVEPELRSNHQSTSAPPENLSQRQMLGIGILLACRLEVIPEQLPMLRDWGHFSEIVALLSRRQAESSVDDEASSVAAARFPLLRSWADGDFTFSERIAGAPVRAENDRV